jgi:hypothetical protein
MKVLEGGASCWQPVGMYCGYGRSRRVREGIAVGMDLDQDMLDVGGLMTNLKEEGILYHQEGS